MSNDVKRWHPRFVPSQYVVMDETPLGQFVKLSDHDRIVAELKAEFDRFILKLDKCSEAYSEAQKTIAAQAKEIAELKKHHVGYRDMLLENERQLRDLMTADRETIAAQAQDIERMKEEIRQLLFDEKSELEQDRRVREKLTEQRNNLHNNAHYSGYLNEDGGSFLESIIAMDDAEIAAIENSRSTAQTEDGTK